MGYRIEFLMDERVQSLECWYIRCATDPYRKLKNLDSMLVRALAGPTIRGLGEFQEERACYDLSAVVRRSGLRRRHPVRYLGRQQGSFDETRAGGDVLEVGGGQQVYMKLTYRNIWFTALMV